MHNIEEMSQVEKRGREFVPLSIGMNSRPLFFTCEKVLLLALSTFQTTS